MKFIKKNQISLMAVVAVLLVAGYVNYKYDPEREKQLGETIFVNAKEGYVYDKNNENQAEVEKQEIVDETKKSEEDVLAEFKLQRENMNSELIEAYNKVINNESSTAEKVSQYQEKLNDLISTKHLVTMVENIIKTNGVENVVLIATNGNINAIIASKEDVPKEKIAIVESIIKNEFKVESRKISITVKKLENKDN